MNQDIAVAPENTKYIEIDNPYAQLSLCQLLRTSNFSSEFINQEIANLVQLMITLKQWLNSNRLELNEDIFKQIETNFKLCIDTMRSDAMFEQVTSMIEV